MPAHRSFHTICQQSKFATVAGENHQGARNEQFDQQQGYCYDTNQLNYNGIQQAVRGGALIPTPLNNQGRRTQ